MRFIFIYGGWKELNKVIGKVNEKSFIICDKMDGGWIGIVNEWFCKIVEE